jgi:Glycosyl transferases group 1
MAIYALCPDSNRPGGGVRKLYRHVDVLNRNGWRAAVLHRSPGFRCSWFENTTAVACFAEVHPQPSDVLLVPEIYGPAIATIKPGIRKVIFNQNCHLTFHGYPLAKRREPAPYRHPDTVATLVVSEDSQEYLATVFPGLRVHRLHYGIDRSLFRYAEDKRPQAAFMPRRGSEDARQVINALNCGGALRNLEVVAIDGRSESETAEMLREALVFFSFSRAEGFGLPPAEAMACGCAVVGFPGFGGREFFRPEHCWPVPEGDVAAFVRTAREMFRLMETDPESVRAMRRRAAEFIAREYSVQREESDIVEFWSSVAPRE